MFERYSELKNVRRLKAELDHGGYVSKRRTTKTGRTTGGKSFERGALYTILKNRIYLGLTLHKGEAFDGEHEPIIDKALFDKVQTILTSNRRRDKHKSGAKDPSLLSGKIVTDAGITLTPTHAQTHRRKYRYYVERSKQGQAVSLHTRPIRLPAQEIETSVCNELAAYLSNPIKLSDDLGLVDSNPNMQKAVRDKANKISNSLQSPTRQVQDNVVIRSLVQRIELTPDIKGYKLITDLSALAKVLDLELTPPTETVKLHVSLELKVYNNGKKVIISSAPAISPAPNPSLIKALKTAHEIKQQYMGQQSRSLSDIAKSMSINKRQIWISLKLAFLAPDIQLAILSGTQPKSLCLQDIMNTKMPTDWSTQREALGFT